MASEERNALAELANEMSWIGDILLSEGYADYYTYADKAQRIIAELAKVECVVDCNGNRICLHGSAFKVLENCRAIAEEGAKE